MTPRTPFWAEGPTGGADQVAEAPPWRRVQLAGVWLPGVCDVRSSGRSRRVEFVAGAGDSSQEQVDMGAENADVQIVCRMWTPEHLAAFETFRDAVEEQGGTRKDPKALDVVHPGLSLMGISSVYVLSISVPEPSGLPGVYESMIIGSEFKPKKPGKPKTVASSVSATPANLSLAPEVQTAVSPAATEAGP